MNDFSQVSCIECLTSSTGTRSGESMAMAHTVEVFPHFVAIGNSHVHPERAEIASVSFTVDDIEPLFHDFDAFGHVIDSRGLIDAVASANQNGREVVTGPEPQIAYFTGKVEVIAVGTALGKVRVCHMPRYNLGGPAGVFIKNKMTIVLEPVVPITFDDAVDRVMALLRFLCAAAGRPQEPRHLRIGLVDDDGPRKRWAALHWSYLPNRDAKTRRAEEQRPHPADVRWMRCAGPWSSRPC